MTPKQINKLAMRCGMHSAMMMALYKTPDALCDSELEELRLIHKFAKLIESATREECARVCRDMQNGFASDQHIECAESIERMK